MFLPAILCAALSFVPQQPPRWFHVEAATAAVGSETVARVEADAQSGLQQLRGAFRGLPKQPFAIVVHRSMASMPEAVAAALHPHTPGVALLGRHEIHLVLDNLQFVESGQLRSVVVHELVHELLDQLAGAASAEVPRWLHEGLAQTLAGDTYLGGREEDLIWRVGSGQLLPFDRLVADFPRDEIGLRLAYAQSYSYVAWLVREFGVDDVLAAVRRIDQRTSFLGGLVQITRQTSSQLADGWRDYLVYGSGARSRALLDNCFYLSMILALPLVALALIRRLRSDRRARERLERYEQQQQSMPEQTPADDDRGAEP